jgi:hypothetical protein
MLNKFKKYYTKLGYVVSFHEYGKESWSGTINFDSSDMYYWNPNTQKLIQVLDEDGEVKGGADEDFDLVESRETFEKEVKEEKKEARVYNYWSNDGDLNTQRLATYQDLVNKLTSTVSNAKIVSNTNYNANNYSKVNVKYTTEEVEF